MQAEETAEWDTRERQQAFVAAADRRGLQVRAIGLDDMPRMIREWNCELSDTVLKWDYKGQPQSVPPWSVGGQSHFTPSLLADGKIFMPLGVGNNTSGIALIRATPDKFIPLGYFAPGMIQWTPLALAGGMLCVRTESGISCYDLRA